MIEGILRDEVIPQEEIQEATMRFMVRNWHQLYFAPFSRSQLKLIHAFFYLFFLFFFFYFLNFLGWCYIFYHETYSDMSSHHFFLTIKLPSRFTYRSVMTRQSHYYFHDKVSLHLAFSFICVSLHFAVKSWKFELASTFGWRECTFGWRECTISDTFWNDFYCSWIYDDC